MKKRGQVSLFVILGIILIALILIMLYYRSAVSELVSEKILQKEVVLPREVNEVKDHVQMCVDDMSLILLYQIGAQGGLVGPSEDNGIVADEYSVAYGYYNGKNVLPSLVDFNRDFSSFMNSFLPACLNMGDFGKLDVKGSRPITSLEFLDDKVVVSVDYPITVTEGENVYKIKQPYAVEYPLRIKLLHDLSDGIVKKTATDPKNIDVSYLLSLNVKVDIYPHDDKTIVYALQDANSVVNDVPFEYRFAVRHTK